MGPSQYVQQYAPKLNAVILISAYLTERNTKDIHPSLWPYTLFDHIDDLFSKYIRPQNSETRPYNKYSPTKPYLVPWLICFFIIFSNLLFRFFIVCFIYSFYLCLLRLNLYILYPKLKNLLSVHPLFKQ